MTPEQIGMTLAAISIVGGISILNTIFSWIERKELKHRIELLEKNK